jgi:hypothetical protein
MGGNMIRIMILMDPALGLRVVARFVVVGVGGVVPLGLGR